MKNTVKINSVDLINADCLHFIQSLPDDSIDLIVTDPPYFKVKPNGWDNQWQLPNEADYRKLQALFSRIAAEKFQEQQLEQPHHQLVASYDSLNRKYSELLDEFKSLRRYFSVSVSVPYTDVWMHKPVQFYPGKHPCEKPADMLRQIINASSRPGDLVADFFMGSGSTIKAAMALGRRALGVELESERFNQTVKEINELVGK